MFDPNMYVSGVGMPPPVMMDTMNLPGMNPTSQGQSYSNNRYEGNHYNSYGGSGSAPPQYSQGPPQYGNTGGGGYRGRGGGGYRGRGRGGMGAEGGGYYGNGAGEASGGFGNNPLAGLANPLDSNDPRNRCNFFHKMGACRHGDNCTKFHVRPINGQTVLFPKMFPNPLAIEYLTDREWSFQFDKKFLKKQFHNFYKSVWRTLMKIGRIVELRVVSNLCEHLVGNVYVKFAEPEKAAFVCENLRHRKYMDILLLPEMTPVSDFNEACCKEDRDTAVGCERKLQCNFLHLMKVSRDVMEKLVKEQDEHWEAHEKAARKEKEKEAQREKEKAEKRAKEREREGATSSHGERDRDRDDKDKRDKREDRHRDKGRDRDRERDHRDRHRDRSRERDRERRRRDDSRDRRDRRERSRDRDRDRDRDRERRDVRKRDRSPGGTVDERLCMVCGEKGHISKDCPQLRN